MQRVISPMARIDGLHDQGDWKANGTGEIAAEKTRPRKSGNCPKSPAAHDWLRAAKRAMCVSLERSGSPPQRRTTHGLKCRAEGREISRETIMKRRAPVLDRDAL